MGEGRREKVGNKTAHTVSFIGSSYTHTKYVHKHKYSNVQIYTGLTDHPRISHPAPQPVPWWLRFWMKVCRGLAPEGGTSGGGRGPAPLSSQVPPKGPVPSQWHRRAEAEHPPAVSSGRRPHLALLLADAPFPSPSSLRVPAAHSVSVSPAPVGRTASLPGPHRRLGLRCRSAEALVPLAGSLLGAGGTPSPGQPCWIRMSAHSWLPARRA